MNNTPSEPWLILKLAQALYDKAPATLTPAEHQRVQAAARRQAEIERRILATPEAAELNRTPQAVDQALAEIQARYPSPEDFRSALGCVGLTPQGLRAAVARDLVIDAVLEQVAERVTPVSEAEVEAFYRQHPERFSQPERRTLRHLLITVNEDLPTNTRAAVQARIAAIRTRLIADPARFADESLAHSECPTALNGGLIGTIPRGQLYTELDVIAFTLAEGELSEPIASPLGLHLLWCERIYPAYRLPLSQVREQIRIHLQDQRRAAAQRQWIGALFKN